MSFGELLFVIVVVIAVGVAAVVVAAANERLNGLKDNFDANKLLPNF